MKRENIENKPELDEISLKDILLKLGEWHRYILSKWVTIVVFSIAGGALGVVYCLINKPLYIATTTFVLEESDKGGGLGQYSGIASMVGIDVGGGGGGIFQGDNILELYKSRTMIQKTLLTEVEYNGHKQLLVERYIDFNKIRDKWSKRNDLKNIHFNQIRNIKNDSLLPDLTRLQDSVLGVIVSDINTSYLNVSKLDKKLNIIKAEVKAKDEFFAKTFNEQIVKNVNDFYIQTKTRKSLDNVTILQQKTDSVRNVMYGSIYSAATISDATPNLNPTRQVQRSAPLQKSQVSVEANKAMLSELLKNLELSKISLRKEAPLIQVVDQPIYPLEKRQTGFIKGAILGFFLSGFLTIFIFLVKKVFYEILN